MDPNTWDREGPSREDSQDIDQLDLNLLDPLAILGADLALCLQATKDHIGGFCDWCMCNLKYHVTCSDGACEICGCVELHHIPPMPLVTSAKLSFGKPRDQAPSDNRLEQQERERDARDALKELTE